MQTPADSLEAVVRRSYGRILAYLSARSGDIAGAEDALADAFRIALERWPASGAPASPEAWLLTTARRRLLDRAKHARVAEPPRQPCSRSPRRPPSWRVRVRRFRTSG